MVKSVSIRSENTPPYASSTLKIVAGNAPRWNRWNHWIVKLPGSANVRSLTTNGVTLTHVTTPDEDPLKVIMALPVSSSRERFARIATFAPEMSIGATGIDDISVITVPLRHTKFVIYPLHPAPRYKCEPPRNVLIALLPDDSISSVPFKYISILPELRVRTK